jgi:hypothetical protein
LKSYQVTTTSQTQIQNNRKDFLKAIKNHLNHLEASSSILIAPDTPQISNNPQTSTSHVNTMEHDKNQTSAEEKAFREKIPKINKLSWRNPTPKTTDAGPDIGI